MALRSDSSIAKKIVSSFVDLLRAVELAPGKDAEALEVATQCLSEVFDISDRDERVPSDKLLGFFSSENPAAKIQEASTSEAPEDSCRSSPDVFGQFMEGLEGAGYFTNGTDDRAGRWNEAQATFSKTLKELQRTGKDHTDLLCEAFKAQGNEAMSAQRYGEAVDLYTLAISISGHNAIYFGNRAAAHTQTGNYNAAISDCHKAIEIDPSYSKAYSRLGLAYYSQGQYLDAVKWFKKALELDPSNTSTRENLQGAQVKLNETLQGMPGHESETSTRADQPQATMSRVTVEAEIPSAMLNSMYPGRTESEASPGSGAGELPPFTDFVQAVMRGLATGGDEFTDTVGPEFSNYVHLFGGLGQRSPRDEGQPEATQRQSAASAGGSDTANASGEQPSGQPHPQARVHVQSSLPEEFTERLQAALQSVLGVPPEEPPTQQQP